MILPYSPSFLTLSLISGLAAELALVLRYQRVVPGGISPILLMSAITKWALSDVAEHLTPAPHLGRNAATGPDPEISPSNTLSQGGKV